MRHVLLLAAAVVPLVVATAEDASAQRHFGGAGFRAGGGAWGARSMGVRSGWHGGGAWRGGGSWRGTGWRGAGWRGAGWYGGGWNRPYIRSGWGWRHPGYYRYRGWNSGWGWGVAGLAAGAAIGAAAAAPYYYDPYVYHYPVYAAPVFGAAGGYCATRVRTCVLISPGVIGTGCSCRVAGGRARGTVVGP